jgi:mRNA-degrading endonuclease RelE of RelBE toxin-antitoxin system
MLRVYFHPRTTKQLLRIPKSTRIRILDTISGLELLDHPLQHSHVIKLSGRGGIDFRLRISDYRVKFSLQDDLVRINRIEHRQVGY